MLSDFHMHTQFSGDSETPARDMIERCIALGMKTMCVTDHYDLDFPEEPNVFLFEFPRYFETMQSLRERYQSKIDIRIGVELGLQPHLQKQLTKIVSRYPFDFIIGSSHVVDRCDPYYAAYFEDKSEEEAYRRYFQTMPDNLAAFSDVDVYGHLDYIVRYGPTKDTNYSYEQYQDCLDAALNACIQHGIGLELNTGGLARGMRHPHPHPDILKRYKELGGEIVTIGSDAHAPERIAYAFDNGKSILKACGFSYYTIFKQRKPEFIKLS